MSDTDSFIEEVSEEVRRDRLFKLMKKYGWIGIAVVMLLVGGAAYNEWQKAQTRQAAENLGDQVLSALKNNDSGDRLTALNEIAAGSDADAVIAMLKSNEAVAGDLTDEAKSELLVVVSNETLPTYYRHLAEFKLLLLESESLDPEVRIARFEPLTAAGAPYRLLASEQIAIIEISTGNSEAALQRLSDILIDGEITTGLRRRVSQLIVALGGDLSAL
ncbi:MAG: tetratricopeptide repeat protein [Paracoccaceae bacterium]